MKQSRVEISDQHATLDIDVQLIQPFAGRIGSTYQFIGTMNCGQNMSKCLHDSLPYQPEASNCPEDNVPCHQDALNCPQDNELCKQDTSNSLQESVHCRQDTVNCLRDNVTFQHNASTSNPKTSTRILQATLSRCVDGLDINQYYQVLDIQRLYLSQRKNTRTRME